MPSKNIKLDFGGLVLEVELFDTEIASKFFDNLPYSINVTQWGNELYGSIGHDLGEENPIPEIPQGGIAYTNNGNYLCVFYGQTPAWPVEYIGQIRNNEWKKLLEIDSLSLLKIYC
ncbi:MAG: hypothetical protein KZQ83_12455 [gamma proteobacterium symbiont of Taylorina sp.]|nr:hypothetical protein [gamma proteobacterium symbiont of Taylorina sp.]